MGKGKGAVDHWVAVVKPGRILFEVSGISEEAAKEVLKQAAYKLPIKTQIVARQDLAGGEDR
jgi:large subunit ribosomal protein L16